MGAQFLEPVASNAILAVSVQLQYIGDGFCGTRRAERLLLLPFVVGDDSLQLDARGEFSLFEVLFRDSAVREETAAETDAAHVQAFQLERREPLADDEFG